MSNESKFVIFAYVLIVFSIVCGSIGANTVACKNQAISFDKYEFKIFGGCMVEHKGKWIPLRNIRGIDL